MSASWWSRLATILGAVVFLLAALGLIAMIGLFVSRSEGDSVAERRRQAGLRPPVVVDYVYWLASPIVGVLAEQRVRPNHLTATALGLAAAAGTAVAGGYDAAATLLLIATGGCDLLDGHLARRLDQQSQAGAFFDSFADRIAESFILGGLAFRGGGGLLTWLAIWALVASLAISYARARAEGLGVDGAVGLMQRPERFGLIIITLAAAALAGLWAPAESAPLADRVATAGIGLLAVLATGTAIRRARWIFIALRAEDGAPAEPEASAAPLDPEPDSES